jgi:hypothetical protein
MSSRNSTRPIRSAEPRDTPISQTSSLDLGVVRPWRIALLIKHMQVRLIIDLIGTLTVGRSHKDMETSPDIDLRPFDAESLGVSRQHLQIKLEGDRVVVIDTGSANGSTLDGIPMKPNEPFQIRHKNELCLAALEMEVALLINPLD